MLATSPVRWVEAMTFSFIHGQCPSIARYYYMPSAAASPPPISGLTSRNGGLFFMYYSNKKDVDLILQISREGARVYVWVAWEADASRKAADWDGVW